MKLRTPLSGWDPVLRWLFISLFVLTGIGYLLVSLIVLKGQKKWVWAEEENNFWNQVSENSTSAHLSATISLDQIVNTVRRDLGI